MNDYIGYILIGAISVILGTYTPYLSGGRDGLTSTGPSAPPLSRVPHSPYHSDHSHDGGRHVIDVSRLLYMSNYYEFAMVSDLDEESYDPSLKMWKSYFKRGTLIRNKHTGNYTVKWGEVTLLKSHTATKNRSMELSELVKYRNLLLAICDYTGMAYKVIPESGRVFLRYAIADGDGEHPKPFKAEWATVKGELLWVGSFGNPWIDSEGRVVHYNPQWVKSIDYNGRIENYNWRPVYEALKTAANCTADGYLWHEAIWWDERNKYWVILPRKRSASSQYNTLSDETKGTNILLIATEDFTDIKVQYLGEEELEWGYSAITKLPGTNDTFVALKVREIGQNKTTKMTVFDLRGNFYLDEQFLHVEDVKYEGIAVLNH